MTTLAIAADLDLIEDGETLGTYAGALGNIKVVLPQVVTGGASDAVDDGVAFEFQNDGDATLEIIDFDSTQRVALMEGYTSMVLRSMANLDGEPRWHVSDNLKEIIAVAEDSHIADLAVTSADDFRRRALPEAVSRS